MYYCISEKAKALINLKGNGDWVMLKCDKCGRVLNKGYSGSYLIATLDTEEEIICCDFHCWEELDLDSATIKLIDFDIDKCRLQELVNKFEGLSNEDISAEEKLELFSYVIKADFYPNGMYISTAHELLENGFINEYGEY